jgi:pimeloyl-ACP methyl ester carboxylesterase
MDKETAEAPKFFNSCGLSMQYAKWGSGSEPLLAFHGFGRSYSDFIPFTQPLLIKYTVYGFNVFFHGQSHIGERPVDKAPIHPEELAQYITDFLDHHQIKKCSLMGYSLGGRMALKLAELLPEKINALYLLAPDGLVKNRWYAMLSQSKFGRRIFRFFIRNNPAFLNLLGGLNRTQLVSNRLKGFILSQIKTTEMQWKVYKVWSFLRKIEPDFKVLGSALSEHEIVVELFFGKYDRIIPEKNAKKLLKHYPAAKIHNLESGHALLTEENAGKIAKGGWI